MNFGDFTTELIDKKIEVDSSKLVFKFYEMKVTMDLNNEEIEEILHLASIKLTNYLGYNTYRTGEHYIYNGNEYEVQINEFLVAIKQ